MKNLKILFSLVILFNLILFSCSKDSKEDYVSFPALEKRANAGGGTTIYTASSNSYNSPAPNLNGADLDMHLAGDAQFEAAFVSAPAEVNGGVGPIFNNSSCIACHAKDGRARFPDNINSLSGFFLRASLPGIANDGGPVPVPNYGLQIQNQAIAGFEPEAQYAVDFLTITEILADGTKINLQKPSYRLINGYMPVPDNILLSPRIAPPVFGLGLLEALPEEEILMNQDIYDSDADGISGKANYFHDTATGKTLLGRFGWKANTATVLEQCAGAYNGDMGVTNYMFYQETGFGQRNGDDGLGENIEIIDEILDQVAFYCKTLAVPAARNLNDEAVIQGSQIFDRIDCAKCHVPSMTTGPSEISAISNQVIYAYTDMLLHDMGEGLADNRPDFLADGQEWKTRPLWGIGLSKVVNGHTDFLHDGRAKNLTEDILWHGGEAENSKNQFKQLPTQERNNLLKFLNSL